MNYYDLPESIQYKVNKNLFSETILPCLINKDWWWHTVICRANIDNPGFLDAEYMGGEAYFSYGIGKNKKRKIEI